MVELELLEKWLDDLNKIIFDINVSMENINRMTSPNDEYERQILKHGFFFHFYRQSRFTIIVQLCKLFDYNENQKRNYIKLFNCLTSDYYDEKINEILANNKGDDALFSSKEAIIEELNKLRSEIESHKALIDNVVTLRDKVYAHSDPETDIPIVTNAELEILVKLAVKIHNCLTIKLFSTTYRFDMTAEWNVDYPIKTLALFRKDQLKENENKKKQ